MNLESMAKLGRKAFTQSLNPYHESVAKSVAILGLDSEYVPRLNQASELICWQLASSSKTILRTSRLSLKNLYSGAKTLIPPSATTIVFVVFYSLAEIQFFQLDEWEVSEFKGKYGLKQN